MFAKKKKKKNEKIKLLKIINEKQILEFAKIKKLKFKVSKKNKEIEKMMQKIDGRYPNAKFNLIKNIEKLNRLTNEK